MTSNLRVRMWLGWGGVALTFALGLTRAQGVFVIEAEDFNYGGGQHVAAASTMPYLGGAYQGLSAVANVDQSQVNPDGSSDEYRQGESPNVPMTQNPDFNRGPWDLTVNYRIGWTEAGDWYNYTRHFPAAFYQVYAALSHSGTDPGLLKGSLQRIAAGATTVNQTVVPVGEFDAPGSGAWGGNHLVPLVDGAGQALSVRLEGLTTLRYTAVSGDIDYYKFVPLVPPQIVQQPTNLVVVENDPAAFAVRVSNTDTVAYQWQSNGVALAGATLPEYRLAIAPLAADGARYRCVLTNALGTTVSREAVLSVTPDRERPTLADVLNLGPTGLRIVFSEPVETGSATALANYALSGGVSVSSAALSNDLRTVTLTVSPLTLGTRYVLTVNGVRDRAVTPNTIAPDTQWAVLASEYAPADIGGPPVAGSATVRADGLDVSGSGSDIGGTTDQFHFEYQQRSGNFDLRLRVQAFTPTDLWAKAGLMARETLAPNSRFAAALTTPGMVGSLFMARTATAGAATSAGSFPANYPETWLRLVRAGNVFTGYASLDGTRWTQLGSATIALPSTLFFGHAVASRNPAQAARVEFRDLGSAAGGVVGNFAPTTEPLGPSSRHTGLVLSELMYHPAARGDGRVLEFVELYNSGPIFEDLTGFRLSGAIDYAFAPGTLLPAGGFLVVARAPADVAAVYGLAGVLGPYTNSLQNAGGTVRLRNELDAVLLEAAYGDRAPWPVSADGAGHSLVLARPSYGEGDPRAWAASDLIGGSPGRGETVRAHALADVLINEFLAHTDDPQLDFIELYNHSNLAADLSGCVLTDDPSTNRFRWPEGTILPARGFLSVDQTQLGFALNAAGETLYLINSNATRVLDAVRFAGQANGVATGRTPDGDPRFRPLATPTPGAANAPFAVADIVLNELMYHPISRDSDDEYVELYNRGAQAVDLGGWRFTDGIDFTLPSGTRLAAGSYLVVARNAARLIANYPNLSGANTVGNYAGSLANGGERVALSRPDLVVRTNAFGLAITNTIYIVVDEVTYADGGRWPGWADGGGSSLELIDPYSDHARASNWADSDESAKAPWTTIEFTGVLDHGNGGYPPNQLQMHLLGAGECLVDAVEVFKPGGANLLPNPGFESGLSGWAIQGNHRASALEAGTGVNQSAGLHVRTTGRGDTGANRIRAALNPSTALASGNTATLRAKVRWLKGWPEFLLRLRGNWLEATGPLIVPKNLGTPGARNSRAVANAGPAIFDVAHAPVVPAANQAVVVTARATDPHGLGAVLLKYRVDPSASLATLTMNDAGFGGDAVAGDGVFSATLPGRGAGTLIAFHVEATDAAAPAATTTFPADAPVRGALVRWGDPPVGGSFGAYRLWQTAAQFNLLRSRERLANDMLDGTFVYNQHRAIYNFGMRAKGSPFHQGSVGSDYLFAFPPDDRFLGAEDLALVTVGNLGNDDTAQREQAAYWIGRKIGTPYLHRRYVHFYENGSRKSSIYEDTEEPNGDYLAEWFPDDPNGDFHKIEDWFEFDDAASGFSNVDATLQRFVTTGGALKLARYRWDWRRRAVQDSANDYARLFDLVLAANDSSPAYTARVENLVDIDQWMRVFAMQHTVGNWDAYGYNRGKNCYAYKPTRGKWALMAWDIDFVLGLSSDGPTTDVFGCNDPTITRMYQHPPFQRAYWRAFLDACNGPLLNAAIDPVLDARYQALRDNGIGVASPAPVKKWVSDRRNYLLGRLASVNSAFALTSHNGNSFSTNRSFIALTGTAPVAVKWIAVNGTAFAPTWTGVTTWSLSLPLATRTNVLNFVGLDARRQPLPGADRTITVTYTGTPTVPQDTVVLNEIHYHPAVPRTGFVELFNNSTTAAFDLSGWRLEGASFTFPPGTVLGPNAFALVVQHRGEFAKAFGANLIPAGEFAGTLQNNGELLRLVQPGATPEQDLVIDEVRYDDDPPWPPLADGWGPSLQLVDSLQDNGRVGNWATTATNVTVMATPGTFNNVRRTLAPFPPLWLNEVLPQNLSGARDRAGDRDPWIELYHAGTAPLDLGGLYLSASGTNLTQWQFPANSLIPAGGFLVVWADGEPAESGGGELHTNFRLAPATGTVTLSRLQGGEPGVIDYLPYEQLSPDRSVGLFPDGRPRGRRLFHYPTPGATNNPAAIPIAVFFNEWMASNTRTLADPADGDFDDWFELYNAGTNTVDLTAYTLTDDLTNRTKFTVPPGTRIPPGGFLLVWADEETGQNTTNAVDLHVNFKLAAAGEALGLFAPDGTAVDTIVFGPQTNDVSQGRFPDGAPGPYFDMTLPTPRQGNVLESNNRPPTLGLIGDRVVDEDQELSFTATATDPDTPAQQLTFSLVPGAPAAASLDPVTGQFAWTPSEADGPGVFSLTLRVTDDGAPPRSAAETFRIAVREVNRPPVLAPVADLTVDEGALLSLTFEASDPDLPANGLRFSLDPGAPAGAALDPATGVFTWTPTEDQGEGLYTLTARVTDDGTPPLAATRTFRVTVREVNNPPVVEPWSAQTVNELSTLTLTLVARDPDTPPAGLTFAFAEPPPSGATLDPVTGVFSWTPTEEQGPNSYLLKLRVTENNPAALSTVVSVTVVVEEVNSAPTLAPLADVDVLEGTSVRFVAQASDADRPAQTLQFSLEGAPAGATLDPQAGAFVWNTDPDQGASAHTVTVRVTDSGTPALSATRTFSLRVRARLKVVLNEIMYWPTATHAEFVELHNASAVTPVDLAGWRLAPLEFTFPAGTVLAPRAYLAVAKQRAAFDAAYGPGLAVLGDYPGTLERAGDLVRLVQPGATPAEDRVIDEVRFEARAPWPLLAAGSGPSLQLIDPLQDRGRAGNWTAVNRLATNAPQTLVTLTHLWRFNQAGVDLGTAWRAPEYHDAAWPAGAGLLYVEDAALPAPKNTALTLGATTYYFRARFDFAGNPNGATLKLRTVIDDGAVFYLNGQELYRLGLAEGAVTAATFASRTVTDAALEGPFEVPATALRRGENVLAVEVHQINATSSDVVMGAALEVTEVRLAAFTPAAENSVRAALPAFPPVWLNEVLPVNATGATDAQGDRDPWIELFNASTHAVPLEGLALTDRYSDLARWLFPSNAVLLPGEHLVVWADAEPGESRDREWHTSFRLASTDGTLALSRRLDGAWALLDHLNFAVPAADVAYGSLPDGSPTQRHVLLLPTPGAANQPGTANRPPTLEPVADQVVDEETLLALALVAADPDPGQTLSLALVGEVPPGATVHPATGAFAWTPSEAQGPGTYTLTVQVTDNGLPALSATRAFRVAVREVNRAPVLGTIPDRSVRAGATLEVNALATDPDLPPNRLTFALDGNVPAGLGLDPVGGRILWTVPPMQPPGTHVVTVRVDDDGVPPLSATGSFRVTVEDTPPPPRVTGVSFAPDGSLALRWTAEAGRTYRVWFKDDLGAATWTLAPGVVAIVEGVATYTEPAPAARVRFYRVQLE